MLLVDLISFEFFGLTLSDPLSSGMNWVLAVFCFYYCSRLKKAPFYVNKYWAFFFFLFSISFFFGGISHLFFKYLGMSGKIPGWSMAALAASSGELAMISTIEGSRKRQISRVLSGGKLIGFAVLLCMDLSFAWVMAHTAGFWAIMGIIFYKRVKTGQTGYRFFLYGMLFLLLMAVVKIGQVAIGPDWLNQDDIAHFIMIGMYWAFFRGALGVHGKPPD